jgi:hypothetical protein
MYQIRPWEEHPQCHFVDHPHVGKNGQVVSGLELCQLLNGKVMRFVGSRVEARIWGGVLRPDLPCYPMDLFEASSDLTSWLE